MQDNEFNKPETLRYIHQVQHEELNYRRKRELQVFNWSAAILLAIIVWLLVKSQDPQLHTIIQKLWGRFFASFIILGFTYFSVQWQLYYRRRVANHAKVLVKIASFFKCFEDGYYVEDSSLLPHDWEKWGTNYLTFKEHLKTNSKISMTTLLGVCALVSLWLDKI